MSLFKESTVRQRAKLDLQDSFNKTASQIIIESSKKFNSLLTYDIFLSHSIKDSELILGMKGLIEDLGYRVYVDWIDDPELDRSKVTSATAEKIRIRMKASKSLFFVTTNNTDNSKWMPWECGYFDGIKEKVAIVPIKMFPIDNEYLGQEYLGLYPYVVQARSNHGNEKLWVHLNKNKYTSYDNWIAKPNNKINWSES